jgi:hypothetical protein
VTARPDGQGGAVVFVEDIALFPPYAQDSTWVGFLLSEGTAWGAAIDLKKRGY